MSAGGMIQASSGEAHLDDDACISYPLLSISTNSSSQRSISWVNPKCKAKDVLLHEECQKKLVYASRLVVDTLRQVSRFVFVCL